MDAFTCDSAHRRTVTDPDPDREAGATVVPETVRPKAFVADGPVIRRIGDRELFLGNVHATDPDAHDRRFAFVVSVNGEPGELTTHHRPLSDGPGNPWSDFADAVDTVRRCMRRDGSVLVNCTAGVSRSTTVLAAAIAAEDGTRFRAGYEAVRAARRWAIPHPSLHELGVYYVAAEG